MSHLENAIKQLTQQVDSASIDACRVEVAVEIMNHDSVLPWMANQPIFPKFYWQSRDTTEEVVALGQVRTFDEINPAYSVLSQDQRIWGGYAFPYKENKGRCLNSFFFLPSIELIRRNKKWFLAANLTQDRDSVRQAISLLTLNTSNFSKQLPQIETVTHSPNRAMWNDNVELALNNIIHTDLKKVVLARQTTIKLDAPLQGVELLALSRKQNCDSFHFLFQLEEGHSFIGSTPERLYSRRGSLIETEALAGTTGRDSQPHKDLQLANWLINDKKNLQENQYVVDDIVERLAPFCSNIDVENEARLVRLRSVQHLKRHIQAELIKHADKGKLLQALQPTAAVAGLPRHLALEFIEKHEPFSRAWYSGSVGYISEQNAEFCVSIRSALVQQDCLHLFAGAGIVPGSEAEHEWQELDKKMSTLLSLITEQNVLEQAS
ncbi:isochorismate synthase [Vibrio sp. UCD-FRSSP16_10]|uniref:isochorismate synthase n=1 Tax=unclassified Vibrio TaxID=2614977 RepID=UPI0007FECC07|nr:MULTISPECIES: isochorismate synthase [unclassified Vibrio]OBT16035.1 isochorismate synthase [Vibrio sp. UCD-FRSSP16_30]OBT21117.1 isochorismate synthase [Vibrio sp. UCD-FRSSP16_10]